METKEIYDALAEPLPKESIQITKKEVTQKGYDTAGHGYQWVVDRLNEKLFGDWFFSYEIVDRFNGVTKRGKPAIRITVNVSITIRSLDITHTAPGGHVASNFSNALKGAMTNGFKKCAAFFGIGADAYRGELDDDAIQPDTDENIAPLKPPPKTKRTFGEHVIKNGLYANWKFDTLTLQQLQEKLEEAKADGLKTETLEKYIAIRTAGE